jgi:hypothetical protein
MNNNHDFETRLANEAFWKGVFGPDNKPQKEIAPGSRYRTLPAWFPTKKNIRGEVRTREPLMIDLMIHLDVDPDIRIVAEFPAKQNVEYRDAHGKIKTEEHIPDLAALRRDGLVFVMDVMPFNVQAARRNLSALRAARTAHYSDMGARYLLLSETTLRLPILADLKRMWMHREIEGEPPQMAELRQSLRKANYPTTIESLVRSMPLNAIFTNSRVDERSSARHATECNPVFTAVMQMTIRGELDVDLTKRLSPSTIVTRRNVSHA